MKKSFLLFLSFLYTLGTVLGIVYLFRIVFYPYNYLIALAHKLYKDDATFSAKKQFMSYAFKGKYGLISFVFVMIIFLILEITGWTFPVVMLFALVIIFSIVIGLPLPKKIRSETYPKPTWKSYIYLIIYILWVILLTLLIINN